MKKLFGTFAILALALSSAAFEDLGPLEETRQKHPELFVPGSVLVIDVKGTPCYVFSGESEQAFTGDFAESESELYEEAALSAKNNFYEYFSKGDKKTTVTMSGCGVLYQYNDKKVYTAILFVPKSNVVVKKPVEKTVATTKKRTAVAETKPGAPAVSAPPAGQPDPNVAVSENKTAATSPQTEKTVDGAEAKPVPSRFELRVAKFVKRLEKNPDDAISLIALGDLYCRHGDADLAVVQYRKAVKLLNDDKFFDPNEKTRIVSTLASLYEKMGKYDLALKYYHLLLRQRCSYAQRKDAVAAISRLRLKISD